MKKIFLSIAWLDFVWMVLSFIEILCKNVNPNPQYSDWNWLFVFFGEYLR